MSVMIVEVVIRVYSVQRTVCVGDDCGGCIGCIVCSVQCV